MAITWKKLAYAADVSTEIDGDISTHAAIKSANATLGHVMVEDGSLIDVDGDGKLTLGAHKDNHDPQDGSDALDTAAPAALLEVQGSGAGSSHSFARADHAHEIVHDITDNSLVTVDGTTNTPIDDDVAVFTASGLEGQTPAQVAATMALDDIGVPDAAVDFDLQEATDLVVMTVAAEVNLPAANVAIGQLCWCTSELTLHVCTVAA